MYDVEEAGAFVRSVGSTPAPERPGAAGSSGVGERGERSMAADPGTWEATRRPSKCSGWGGLREKSPGPGALRPVDLGSEGMGATTVPNLRRKRSGSGGGEWSLSALVVPVVAGEPHPKDPV
jgi:hypothetical protein